MTDNNSLILFWQNKSLHASTHSVKHFVGSKPPNLVVSTHDNWSIDMINIQSEKVRDGIIYEFNFSARSFLHNQIRSIVGCLEKVGCGKWRPQKMQEILLNKDRSRCAALAPPSGLYLKKVDY